MRRLKASVYSTLKNHQIWQKFGKNEKPLFKLPPTRELKDHKYSDLRSDQDHLAEK